MTDDLKYNPELKENEKTATESGKHDDRWVFTEENSGHEFTAIQALSAAARVLKDYNDELAERCLKAATELYNMEREVNGRGSSSKINAAIELFITTGDEKYLSGIVDLKEEAIKNISSTGAQIARIRNHIKDEEFKAGLIEAYDALAADLKEKQRENPFGVPYNIRVWGDGWGIQRLGMQQYFLHKHIPALFDTDLLLNALNFVLGHHPGENTSSFASGVGSRSVIEAYGVNRADRSFIPGGVVSGTGIIRPDFPELKEWPYFWQQTEYVMGGGATHFMFLVLAADNLLKQDN
jgi:hypothetical protein